MNAATRRLLSASSVLAYFAISGCQLPEGVQAGNSNVLVVPDPSPTPTLSQGDPSKQVCNPLGGGDPTGLENGLYGRLRYIPDSKAPRPQKIADFFGPNGADAGVDLYFNQLFVPTRAFDEGFQTQDGTLLKTPQGDTLYEWFELSFKSTVRLSKFDRAGSYQFAVLSDDGSNLYVDEGDGFEQLINNDGTTASRLACAKKTIRFDNSTALPIKVDYFQGPRYHIALILLWRELPETSCGEQQAEDLKDPACGQSGISEFFDSTKNPPAPSDVWLGMLNRGWKVLNVENYYLPDSAPLNPCSSPTPTPSPSATAHPSPTPSPSPSPSASTSPTPSPSPCTGFGCGNPNGQ